MNTALTTGQADAIHRITSCLYTTCGTVTWEKANLAARELVRRGWVDIAKVDPNTRESSAGPVTR